MHEDDSAEVLALPISVDFEWRLTVIGSIGLRGCRSYAREAADDAVVIERVLPADPPAKSVVAER